MRLILTGCEYAGTTTLVNNICAWLERAMGTPASPHDHFKFSAPLPCLADGRGARAVAGPESTPEGAVPALSRRLPRGGTSFYREAAHHIVVGLHFDEGGPTLRSTTATAALGRPSTGGSSPGRWRAG